MRPKYEWMFPHAAAPQLSGARGESWRELVEYVSTLDEQHEDSLAFTLMMVRLCGCVSCQPGCFKLSLGCATCAYRTVANLKTTDSQLVRRFQSAREEIQSFLTIQEPQA